MHVCYSCTFLNHVFHILEDVGYLVEKPSHLVQLETWHILCWDDPLYKSIRDNSHHYLRM